MIDRPFSQFLDDLAARTSTPGGGAASGFAAAMGLALFRMAFRFAPRKGDDDAVEVLAGIDARLAALDERIRPLAERDAAGFGHVADAYRLPKGTDEEAAVRSRAIQEALLGAMVVPEETLHLVRDCMRIGSEHRSRISRSLGADAVNGAALLLAAARGAWCNVAVNASYLKDRVRASSALDHAAILMQEIRECHDAIRAHGETML